MPSHRLFPEKDRDDGEWLLEWDDAKFVLRSPDGRPAFVEDTSNAHRSIKLYELYVEGKIAFSGPPDSPVFEKNPAASAALRAFVEAGLRSDVAYRTQLKRESLLTMPIGLAMFLVAGSLFALYCWYASWAPDPPPDHWIRSIGWLVHGILLLLLGAALAGPFVAYNGLRQWLRIRRIEREAAPEEATGGGA